MGFFDRFIPHENEEEFETEEIETSEIQETPRNAAAKPGKQVVLLRPNDPSREQMFAIADRLMNRESVIVNLELVAKASRQFVFFLSGVAYALHGQSKKVAANTFLFTPGGVEVSGEIDLGVEAEY